MSINNYNNISELLNKLNNNYKNNEEKSLSDILDSFSQLSKDYADFNNLSINKKEYSSKKYNECTLEEKQDFFNNQLQFIECLVTNSIYEKTGFIWNWNDIYNLMNSESYKNIDKINRKVIYSSISNNRPIGETSYDYWNGLQIIDLDIKNTDITNTLKDILFNELNKYNWFLGICKSASGKGLHVWTKIKPISFERKNKKTEYLCNFRHKYSYVYVILYKYISKLNLYTKEDIMSFMDMAMSKPQQGSFISSDNNAYINTNFCDLRLDVNFESAFDTGVASVNWIAHPDLKQIFAKLDWFNNDITNNEKTVNISNISNINDRNINKSLGRRHYKHAQRWQLANTLCSLYGFDEAYKIMCEICDGTPYRELKGDVRTASIHNKPITIWAVKELNKYHGFNIKLDIKKDIYETELEKIDKEIKEDSTNENDPIKILNDKTKHIRLDLKFNQYLSDIKNDILNNLGKITLLEAGAGYGKTEMIKSLKAKTLLILPFTSTIKAKVEASETTKDWLYFYGNKRPSLDDLLSDKNMSMTIDKFSRLNLMELDQSNFEYIVIDESHLLFTSSYRDVMSPCIQRIANCKAKIIMMTGTPTGEVLFFPKIKHIKVFKEDMREKIFELHLCPTKTEQLIEMCKLMAKDIIEGKKILFPTNKGVLYYEQIIGLIQQFLDEDKTYDKPLKAFYYKKSNSGDESMDNINIEKSIGNNDIIFCTTYLSVGVDITDRYKFSVYFNETWIAQDIEQFANRIRNNDLYLKLFLPQRDSMGLPINYYYTQPLDLNFDKKDILFFRDMIRTCNDMLERNQEESKYSPFISSILATNRCLKYDENDCKYYIDETTYKLKVFEERYSDYSKQLQVLLNYIKYYGYKIDIITHNQEISEDKKEFIDEYLKSCRHIRYNYVKSETFIFLNHLNDGNIDFYKELMKGGSYDIFKSNKYEEDRLNNGLYCKDIEIIEKNIPIVMGLYKFYDCETIKSIFEYCVDKKQNRINYTKLDRIRRFVNIENNRQKSRLDFPVLKFISEAANWANNNPIVKIDDINKWLANYAAKYANSIKDVVVDDIKYFEEIFELIKELWKVIIIQGKTSKTTGETTITPFELLWEKKTNLNDIYGGSSLTQEFFLQELLDNFENKDNLDIINDKDNLPELPHTSKLTMNDIENEIPNIIHNNFEYNLYSQLDGSNDRFLRKQENTNSLRDTIFNNIINQENNELNENNDAEYNLFS